MIIRYNNFVREKQGKVADGISRRLMEKQRQVAGYSNIWYEMEQIIKYIMFMYYDKALCECQLYVMTPQTSLKEKAAKVEAERALLRKW